MRRLAADEQSSPATVQRAYAALARAGVVILAERRGARVAPGGELAARRLLRAGATFRLAGSDDPALALLLAEVGDEIMMVGASGSFRGLTALWRNDADGAALHLRHRDGAYNAPFARALLAGREPVLVHLWQREQGLIVPPGNPLGLHDAAALQHVRVAQRPRGTGTRTLMDRLLLEAGGDPSAAARPRGRAAPRRRRRRRDRRSGGRTRAALRRTDVRARLRAARERAVRDRHDPRAERWPATAAASARPGPASAAGWRTSADTTSAAPARSCLPPDRSRREQPAARRPLEPERLGQVAHRAEHRGRVRDPDRRAGELTSDRVERLARQRATGTQRALARASPLRDRRTRGRRHAIARLRPALAAQRIDVGRRRRTHLVRRVRRPLARRRSQRRA